MLKKYMLLLCSLLFIGNVFGQRRYKVERVFYYQGNTSAFLSLNPIHVGNREIFMESVRYKPNVGEDAYFERSFLPIIEASRLPKNGDLFYSANVNVFNSDPLALISISQVTIIDEFKQDAGPCKKISMAYPPMIKQYEYPISGAVSGGKGSFSYFVGIEQKYIPLDDVLEFPSANDDLTIDGPLNIKTQSGNKLEAYQARIKVNPGEAENAWRTIDPLKGSGTLRSVFSALELKGKDIEIRGIACGCRFDSQAIKQTLTSANPNVDTSAIGNQELWSEEYGAVYVYGPDGKPISQKFIQTSPKITDSETTNVSCVNAKDGEIKITLEKGLENGFHLLYNLREGTSIPTDLSAEPIITEDADRVYSYIPEFAQNPNRTYLDQNNSFTIKNVSQGSFYLVYQSILNSNPIDIDFGEPKSVGNSEKIFKIEKPSQIEFTSSKIDPQCEGDTGSITVTANGGNEAGFPLSDGVYEFSIDGGNTWTRPNPITSNTHTFNSIKSNTTAYLIAVRLVKTGITNCNGSPVNASDGSVEIQEPSNPLSILSILETKKLSYRNANDAAITVNIINGNPSPNFTYSLEELTTGSITTRTNTSRSYTFTDLGAGTYKISVSDGTCRISNTVVDNVVIINPTEIVYDQVRIDQDINCFKEITGSVTIENVRGGTNTLYRYQVFDAAGNEVYEGTSNTFTDLSKGVYSFRIANSQALLNIPGAYASGSFEIGAGITEVTINNVIPANAVCFGTSGSVTVNVTGGKPPYSYRLGTTGAYISLPTSGIIPLDRSYIGEVTIRDANQCLKKSSSVGVVVPREALEVIYESQTNNVVFGEAAGSFKVTVFGGHGGYSYEWEKDGATYVPTLGALTTQLVAGDIELTLSELEAGVYNLTVTDSEGCKKSLGSTVKITEPEILEISEINESKEISCFNGTGELSVSTTGGIGPYRYEWRFGSNLLTDTDAVLENAVAGSYSVIVYDQHTSARPVSVKVLNTPTVLSITTSPKAAACFDEATGSVQINVSGGTSPYRYSLDDVTYSPLNSLSSNTLEGLKAGAYELYVKDVNDCSLPVTANFSINEPAAIQITPVINQEIRVRGAATGILEVLASGGSGVLSYSWTKEDDILFSATTPRITNITTGKYTVSVSDNTNGCNEPATFEVLEPEALQVDLKELLAIKCFGEGTGALEASVSGGYPIISTITDFNLTWFKIVDGVEELIQEGQGLETLNRQTAGEYKVVVTDGEGTMASDTFTLISPTKFEIGLKETGNEQCFEAKDGFIDINVSGGTPPYSYEWNKVEDVTYSGTTQNIADLSVGTYKLTAKDANDCEVNLTEVIDLVSPEIVFTASVSEITGSGLSNGRISITATGGTAPLSYQWSKVGDTSFTQTTATISDLSEGTYIVEIKDVKGCTEEFSRKLLAPDALQVTLNEAEPNACFGATTSDIIATVSGGVPQSSTAPLFDYQWYKIEGTTATELIGEKEVQLINQASGSYRLVVTDKNGNTTQQSITTTQPDEIVVSLVAHQDEQCYQANDGLLEVSVTGGVKDASGNYLAYTYEWRKRGDARFSGSTSRIENLSPGIYRLEVVDQGLCSPLMESEYEIKGVEERLLIAAPQVTDLTGFNTQNGSVAITVIGGTAPYSYVWSSNQASFSSIDSNKIENISSGKYQVVVTDANACSATSIEIPVSEPNQLVARIIPLTEAQAIPCFGETSIAPLMSEVTGGIPPYTYEWINTANSILISTSETAPKQRAGTYELIVNDASGNSASIKYAIENPLELEITSRIATPVSCFNGIDGSVSVQASGGTPPYNYLWNTGETSASLEVLSSGVYTVRITDARGCSTETAITVEEPLALRTAGITTRTYPSVPGVSDGVISVTIVGGSPPYNYIWESLVDSSIRSTPSSNGQAVLNNTNAFGYGLTVTDANDCEFVIDDVDNIEIAPIRIDLSIEKAVSCQGTETASIQARVSGGIPFNDFDQPYVYEWYTTNNNLLKTVPKRLEGIGVGSYYVIVTDAQGIQQQSDVLAVTEPAVLEITNLEESFNSCGVGTDWQINTTVVGGTLPYSYQWSNGTSTADVGNLFPGTYNLTVTDAFGCKVERSITLVPPPAIVITEQIANPICFNACTGSIEIITTGGVAPYSYQWNTGATMATVQNLCTGVYELKVTDAVGCEVDQVYEVVNPEVFTIDLGEDITLCKDQTAELDATIPNGVSYRWTSSNGFLSEQAQVEITATGLYEVIVTNADNCEARDEIFVELTDDEISANFIASSQVFTDESFIIVNIANPKPDITDWDFPENALVNVLDNDFIELTFDIPGTYAITFDVARGLCKESITKQVVVLERDTSVTDQPTGGVDAVVSKFVNYNLYPNPTLDGIFTLDIKMSEPASAIISVYELTNHSIIAKRVLEKKEEHEESFALQTSAAGIYLVVIESELGNQVLKLVVE